MKPQRHFFAFTRPQTTNYKLVVSAVCCFIVSVSFAQIVSSQIDVATRNRSESMQVFAAFQSWAGSFAAMSDPYVRTRLLSEGVILAKRRRVSLVALIKSDPAQALSVTVPDVLRHNLPTEISCELETSISGVGDYIVLGLLAPKGGAEVEPIQRFVHLNGQLYRAYVYGRRAGETTKYGIPMHGILLDGVVALDESSLRVIETDVEPKPILAIIDLRTAAEKSDNSSSLILAEMGGTIYRFASLRQLHQAESRIESTEAPIGPSVASASEVLLQQSALPGIESSASIVPLSASSWTTGNKQILVIRIDFSDLPGDPVERGDGVVYTASYVENLTDTQVASFYLQNSYGLTSLSNTVATQLYRMPQTASYYATNGASNQLYDDATSAASVGYTLTNYDRVIVLFSNLGGITNSQITYAGQAMVGGRQVWVNGAYWLSTVAHELGHTYGVYHANLWQVHDSNPISTNGTSVEYGDAYDPEGSGWSGSPRPDFNPWFKTVLGWISSNQVQTVTTSGTYRVSRFDNGIGTGTLGLKIAKDSVRNYWIGCRRNVTDSPSMQNGAYVIWGYNYNRQSDLLDMTTPGTNVLDAALAVGTTFTDLDASVAIQPVAEGGASPNEYIDVQVTLLPVVSLSPITLTNFVAQGETAPSQTINVWNSGRGTLSYSISSDSGWAIVPSGSFGSDGNTNSHAIIYNSAVMPVGIYNAIITITSPNALNTQQMVAVNLQIYPCTYGLFTNSASFGAIGGSSNIVVTTQSGCPWSVSDTDDWVAVTSPRNGSGGGTITFAVSPNPAGNARTSIISLANQNYTIVQAGNTSPFVSVTPVAPITWPMATAYLNASVTDDGAPYGTIDITWSKVSGPGDAIFGNPKAPDTSVTFSTNGTYLLCLRANDGAASASNDVSVTVNLRPQVTSPPAATNVLGTVGNITVVKPGEVIGFSMGSYDADGNPLSCLWNFGDGASSANCSPSHVFSNCGPHQVSATINDGFASVTTGLTVVVTCPLDISSLKLKANFKKVGSDTCAIKGTLTDLPTGFSVTNATVALDVGDAVVDFQLNAKGRGHSTNGTFKLTYNKRTKIWAITGNLKGDLKGPWANYRITSEATTSTNMTFPVLLMLQSGTVEASDAALLLNYRNKSGTLGTATYRPVK